MNKAGYNYLHSRKKGILLKEDLKIRLAYCKEKIKSCIGQDFWSYGVT